LSRQLGVRKFKLYTEPEGGKKGRGAQGAGKKIANETKNKPVREVVGGGNRNTKRQIKFGKITADVRKGDKEKIKRTVGHKNQKAADKRSPKKKHAAEGGPEYESTENQKCDE